MTMSPTQGPFKHVIAFEVSKASLVVHRLPADQQCIIANTQQAIRRLLRAEVKRNARAKLGPVLIVAEASGGYERCVLQTALDFGVACHRAHGTRVRFFARYLGLIAKTDRIDARVLATYGLKTERLRLFEPLKPEEQALKELQGRRDEIQQMLIAETNRLEHARLACVVRSIKTHIAGLRRVLDAIEAEIAALIDANESLARKARLMRTVIGVGPVTAATLLANMPELGSLTKGEAARLAGLAPINRDSGKLSAPRHIVAGRSAVRRCLYMAALVGLSHNPVLKAFASGLRARGKPFKVVITAVMRKLIVILNAIVRDGEPWTHAKPA
jgi:transposase